MKSPDELGERVIVQGGTFLNDAIVRSLELSTGREVVRPDIAGLMGAFGAALLSRRMWRPGTPSTLIPAGELKNFSVETSIARCPKCAKRLPADGQSF